MNSNIIKNDWENATFGDKLKQWSEEYGEKTALIDEEVKLSYRELYDRSLILARHFVNKGIKRGDNVIVQYPNTYLFVIISFALFEIGALPILVLPAHRKNELNGIISLAKPKMYLTVRKLATFNMECMARELMEAHESIETLLFEDEILKMTEDVSVMKEDITYEKPIWSDVALYLLSGGTTGVPKLIPRTHADYIYNGLKMAIRCKLTEDDCYLAVLPIAHNFTLNNPGIFGTFARGGTCVICKFASPLEILSLIASEKITHTSLVPVLLQMCVDYREIDKSDDLSSLRFLSIGGSYLPPYLASKVKSAFGCKLHQVFGTAEGLICTTDLDDDDETVINYQGTPISEYDELRIVDEEYNDVAPGCEGELITKGLYTIHGYYKLPEVNKTSFTSDGYYCTGDKARIAPNGNLQILGRIKEQINRAGEKIMPSEVEDKILDIDNVNSCAVVGIPDELVGNMVGAFIVMEEGNTITLSELRTELVRRNISDYKLPELLYLIDEWPLTSVDKIDKKQLVKMAMSAEEN